MREEGSEEVEASIPDAGPSPIIINSAGDGQSSELAKAARKVVKAEVQQKQLTDKILDTLANSRAELMGHLPHPSFIQAVQSPEFRDVMKRIDDIVAKYEGGQFRTAELDADILRLGAFLFYLSGRVNNMEMAALDSETALKGSVARAFLRAKNLAAEEKGRLSDEAAKHVALVATDPIRAEISTNKIIAHTTKGLYYAGANLLEMMNSVSHRAYRERHNQSQL
jgi:hypothetical protein